MELDIELYDIIKAPDPVLKQIASPVENINIDIKNQVKRMAATMKNAAGIGLAANQVGVLNRIFVMDLNPKSWAYTDEKDGVLHIGSAYRSGEGEESDTAEGHLRIMINPEIIWHSDQHSVFEEGCLSIPGHYGDVQRPSKIRVKYLDEHAKAHEWEAQGLESHCVQHELDHLEGVLFLDYLSTLKRNMIIRKMQKYKKSLL